VKLLHSTTSPLSVTPPTLAPNQVNSGPYYPNDRSGDRVKSLTTPVGEYDVEAIVAQLPADQYPDLYVARANCTLCNMPRNIGALRCPSVLVVGDTHHRPRPLSALVAYAASEPYDCVIIEYTRHHAHFFAQAGLDRVYWIPNLYVNRAPTHPVAVPDLPMTFVGHVPPSHQRRATFIAALRQAGVPLSVGKASQDEARALHARTRVNFNCSLNGDLNRRVFEVLGSGGFLLTDRLSPQAGLDLLFEDGKHLATYEGLEDCILLSRRYLADPGATAEIARAGYAAYEDNFSPERTVKDFHAVVDGGRVRPEYDLGREPRMRLPRPTDPKALMDRIEIYQVLQLAHQFDEFTEVLATPGVDPYVLTDGADLPRLAISVDVAGKDGRARELSAFFERAGVAEQVQLIGEAADFDRGGWNMVLTTMAEWSGERVQEMVARDPRTPVVVTDLADGSTVESEIVAAGWRRVAPDARLFVRADVPA